MEKRFELLEHTADIRIKAFGSSKEDLVKNALAGMASVQKKDVLNKKSSVTRPLFVESIDLSALLVDFLGEVLALSDSNQEIYTVVEFKEFSDTIIDAELKGVSVDQFDEDIKAVTYHGADVQEVAGGLEVTIVFDI
jgi:SHS2 domain-containing protein